MADVNIAKILFPTDFSEIASHALPYAIRMAKDFEAELIMLHAITLHGHDPNDPEHQFPSLGDYCAELRKSADRRLEVCVDEIGSVEIPVRKKVVQGDSPQKAILQFVKDEGDVGMIVMSTHGRSGFSHVLLGSVAENVIRYAPRPVLVVKRPEHEFLDERTGEVSLKRILFPLDFSKESLRPIDLVRRIASKHGAEVIVYHAIDAALPSIYYTAGIESVLQLDPDLKKNLQSKMRDAVGRKLDGTKKSFVVDEGRAVDCIREYARSKMIDLIIMAATGEHGVSGFLFGSTAARVVQKAVCPVLVV